MPARTTGIRASSPPLTRSAAKRKRDNGEDVQLCNGLEGVTSVSVTRCRGIDLNSLAERYRDTNTDRLVRAGVDATTARSWMESEVEKGQACFQTLHTTFPPVKARPESPHLGGKERPKKKKRGGNYTMEEELQPPASCKTWEQKQKSTAAPPNHSNRPPPLSRENSTKANRSARHGKHKRRGGWRVDPNISQKEKTQLRRELRTDVHQNHLYSLNEDALVTESGWKGRQPSKESGKEVNRQWDDGSIATVLRQFYRIPFNDPRSSTVLTDRNDRIFLYRTNQPAWLKDDVGPKFVELCELLKVDTNYQKIKLPGTRGPHYPIIIGFQRQYTDTPELPVFHSKNYEIVQKFIDSKLTKSVSRHVSKALSGVFPGAAIRYRKCAGWYEEKHAIKPAFGLFWNFCLNVPHPDDGRVHCRPHTDHKNIVGICAVLVYELAGANFDHKKRSWLVVWDAGVMLEAAPWVIMFYPSALFYHFNIDPCDLELVDAPEGEMPTRANSTRVTDAQGRGSMVFFNQASLFQSSETGCSTLDEAERKGLSRVTDADADINFCFQKYGSAFPLNAAESQLPKDV